MSSYKTAFNAIGVMMIIATVASGSVMACADNEKSNKTSKSHGDSNVSKVTICHATNSQKNPYVVITVSTSSIDERNNKYLNGHGDHEGGVWREGIVAHSWGDIIPSFTSPKGAVYAGQNMNEAGKAILNNSCKVPAKVAPVATTPKPVAKDENKGKPVKAQPVEAKPADSKVKNQGKAMPEIKQAVATAKVAGTGAVTTTAAELPRTGAASIAGVLGVLGVVTYAVVRRFIN